MVSVKVGSLHFLIVLGLKPIILKFIAVLTNANNSQIKKKSTNSHKYTLIKLKIHSSIKALRKGNRFYLDNKGRFLNISKNLSLATFCLCADDNYAIRYVCTSVPVICCKVL